MFDLVHYSKSLEPAQLKELSPEFNHSTATSVVQEVDMGGAIITKNSTYEKNVHALNLLMPPAIVPLLHELAQRLVTSGRHQQCCKVYKYVTTHGNNEICYSIHRSFFFSTK